MIQRRVLQYGLCRSKEKCLKPDLKCVNRWSSSTVQRKRVPESWSSNRETTSSSVQVVRRNWQKLLCGRPQQTRLTVWADQISKVAWLLKRGHQITDFWRANVLTLAYINILIIVRTMMMSVHRPSATLSSRSATGCVIHGSSFLPTSPTHDDQTRRVDGSVHGTRPAFSEPAGDSTTDWEAFSWCAWHCCKFVGKKHSEQIVVIPHIAMLCVWLCQEKKDRQVLVKRSPTFGPPNNVNTELEDPTFGFRASIACHCPTFGHVLSVNRQWHRQLWGTGAHAPLRLQQFHF